MLKRVKVQQAITRLGIQNISIPIFQKVAVSPSGSFSIVIRLNTGASLKKLEEIKGEIAVALRVDEVRYKRITPNKVLLTAHYNLPQSLPKYPEEE